MPVLLGLGVLGFAVGQAIWTYYEEILHQPPFPSWADAGYLAAYPFLFAGLFLLPRCPLPSAARLRVLLDGVMIMTGVVAFSWYFVLGPTVLQGAESLFGKLVSVAYPFCDLVLFCCLLLLWGRAQERALRPVVVLFSLGLGCILIIDTAFAYGNLHGTYATGGLVDVGWPLGYMLLALATRAARQALAHAERATHAAPTFAARAPAPPLWRALLPYAFLPAVGALVVSTGRLRGATPLEQGVWIGAGVLGALVVLRQVVALLETLASTDPLTGLLNHRAFHARLDEEIARAARGGRPLALLLVDLDDFRAINNTHGHQAGDRALVAIAAALCASLRAGDSAGRYGGDEFAAILPEADVPDVLAVAERARADVAGIALPAGDATIRATTSLGVAALPRHARTRDELIAAADQAAYAAKDAGKDCVRSCDDRPWLALVSPA